MRNKILSIFICMLLVATIPAVIVTISADENLLMGEVKDQYQEECDERMFFDSYAWQQFVPTMEELIRVEVNIAELGGDMDITLSVEKPLGNVLTSKTLPASSVLSNNYDWVSFNVPDVTLSSGSTYYIVLEYHSGGEYSWDGAWDDPYPQGDSTGGEDWDFCFRTFCEDAGGFEQGVCGQTITESVTLTENIGPCGGPGIIIGASGITLEGNGYKIFGNGNGDGVICQGWDNVVIEHLYVEEFENGIVIDGEGNQVILGSIRDNDVGILLSRNRISMSTGNIVNENIIADNGIGISTECSDNKIYHNLIVNNDQQIQDSGGSMWEDDVDNYGNFWGNYWGTDEDSDGIGDTYLPHEGVDDNPLLNPTKWGGGYILGPNSDKWWSLSLATTSLIWRGGWSPVIIQVTDPFGNIISDDINDIGKLAFYVEDEDFEPGTKMVQVIILLNTLEPFEGTYSFEMTALDNLDYWVKYYASLEETILVQHSTPYGILKAGETQYLEITVDDELNFFMDPVADAGPDQIASEGVPVYFDGSESVDPDGTIVSYEWDFGDGHTGSGVNPTHTYDTADTYTVMLTVEDNDELIDMDTMIVRMSNEPPSAPIIDGRTRGIASTPYTYTFTSTDPNGDDVSYYIKWDDGTTPWTTYQTSGPPGYSKRHRWRIHAVYEIEAQAKDIYGAESDWAILEVIMPRNRAIQTPFLNFLENHPILYQLLQRFLRL